MSMIKKKKPLTKEGHSRLCEEHEYLMHKERPKVVDAIQVAAQEGDRSENAEYIYGKKRLRELDRRLRYLNSLLKDAQVVIPDLKPKQVSFGTSVTLEYEDGLIKEWAIVGEGEVFFDHQVSWQSPLARAIWGKKVDDFIEIHRPKGSIEARIVSIQTHKERTG